MFNQERTELRKFYQNCWLKYQNKESLSLLEKQIITVLLAHPEYIPLFENFDSYQDRDYRPENNETNPFLHLSLHLGLIEQVSTNRPLGIQSVYQTLCQKQGQHEAEHLMMDCLAEVLWQAQRNQQLPDETLYLTKLSQLINS
ncbi:MAG: hypothetical protein A3E87_08715 [Gammaproteobacteria bacterium RIFCSPHIGHO2_12_FULL_35_23]|nr:MAG: hypothetical protein A3E87_08715 [Gammaproteobacteria bacterium RIFCSPHIGHO2_12_FULL_35_23]